MKVRNGFVSNSSSSSFILGLGRVTDLNKAQKIKEAFGYSVQIKTLDEIVTENNGWSDPSFKGSNLTLDCDYACVDISLAATMENDQNTPFIIVSLHNNEGDGCEGSELYQAVYEGGDLDESYFGTQGVLLNLNEEEHGVKDYKCTFGAARNG